MSRLLRRILGALLVAGLAVAGLLAAIAGATTTTTPSAKLAAVGPTASCRARRRR